MKYALSALSAVALLASSLASAGNLVINTDTSDAAPKAAFEALIKQFEEENPDVTVEWNLFDHEGYKQSIRNFLTTNPPDLANWYAGNRMLPYVEAGLFEDVSDLWEGQVGEELSAAKASMTIDGKQWGVPYTYYQWGIYYRKDIFADLGLEVPNTFDELLAVSATLKENDIAPFTIGSKYLWTTAGWFDYMNLRTNGYEFHMDLALGKIPYNDPRVKATFGMWDKITTNGYIIDNHAAYSWQEALTPMVKGEAAMYVMGNFMVASIAEAGLDIDTQLGYFPFPEITRGIPRAEDAPTDTIHIPAGAKNKEDARKFLRFLARADVQTNMNEILGQLPINKNSTTKAGDSFLEQGFQVLSTAYAQSQFYDRDASPEMASEGMKGFQEYMVKPERKDQILDRLEKVRQRLYK